MARQYLYAYRLKVRLQSDGSEWRTMGQLRGRKIGTLFREFLAENSQWSDEAAEQGASKIVLIDDAVTGTPLGVHGARIRVGSTGNAGEVFETDGEGNLERKKTDLAHTDAHLADGHIFGFLADDSPVGHIILHTRSSHRVKTLFWMKFEQFLKTRVPEIVVELNHCAPASSLEDLLDGSDLKKVRLSKTLSPTDSAQIRQGFFDDEQVGRLTVEFTPSRGGLLNVGPIKRLHAQKTEDEATLLNFGNISWDEVEAVANNSNGQPERFSVTDFGSRVPRIGLDISEHLSGVFPDGRRSTKPPTVTPADDSEKPQHSIGDPVDAVVFEQSSKYVSKLV